MVISLVKGLNSAQRGLYGNYWGHFFTGWHCTGVIKMRNQANKRSDNSLKDKNSNQCYQLYTFRGLKGTIEANFLHTSLIRKAARDRAYTELRETDWTRQDLKSLIPILSHLIHSYYPYTNPSNI